MTWESAANLCRSSARCENVEDKWTVRRVIKSKGLCTSGAHTHTFMYRARITQLCTLGERHDGDVGCIIRNKAVGIFYIYIARNERRPFDGLLYILHETTI